MGGATRFLMLLTSAPCPSYRRVPSFLLFSSPSFHHHFLPRPLKIKSSLHLHTHTATRSPAQPNWVEWSNFIANLSSAGYFNTQTFDDEFVSGVDLPHEFVRSAFACVAFARQRPDILGMLSRRDIEVVVGNGTPFLFRNGSESLRRMQSFLRNGDTNNGDGAHTVDLVRFLLSYAINLVSSGKNSLPDKELVERSVRNLLNELAQLSYSPDSNVSGSVLNPFQDRYGQALGPLQQNIEMKRGDWICPRCSFMNFARNVKCLECEEARPKRQLTGGEWECPQCDFFNYGRNIACLRCDCKRPGEISFGTANSNLGYGNRSNASKADLDSRLAANEEKAQRWFSKMSQLDSTSDMSSAIADKDFPEIMPLRKGVNRFVVSTRKSPLERRQANAQYRRDLGNDNMTSKQSSNPSLDEILGLNTAASGSDSQSVSTGQTSGASMLSSSASNSMSSQYGVQRGSNHVPFVPLSADMFAKKTDELKMNEKEKLDADNNSLTSRIGDQTCAVSGSKEFGKSSDSQQPSEKTIGDTLSDEREREQSEKSERWFKRVAELHNVTDLTSAISDEDFPEVMPVRKGESRFVVSRRKDRSLTSPLHKRRMAMEQANDTNFVPFVPFPPNYFAKDNQQSDGVDSTDNSTSGTSNFATLVKFPDKLDNSNRGLPGRDHVQGMEKQQNSTETVLGSTESGTGENSNEMKPGVSYGASTTGNSIQNVLDPQPARIENSPQNLINSPTRGKESGIGQSPSREDIKDATNSMGTASHPSKNQNVGDSWSGKSLEGSAVKEPDPLDMSEEAKAERWFRRVAQIKDISELSQIPDEDFPSIMPMRKGVNRFVVSKRKTPLERRLTSTQYRRNLQIVSSDPVKESDNN